MVHTYAQADGRFRQCWKAARVVNMHAHTVWQHVGAVLGSSTSSARTHTCYGCVLPYMPARVVTFTSNLLVVAFMWLACIHPAKGPWAMTAISSCWVSRFWLPFRVAGAAVHGVHKATAVQQCAVLIHHALLGGDACLWPRSLARLVLGAAAVTICMATKPSELQPWH